MDFVPFGWWLYGIFFHESSIMCLSSSLLMDVKILHNFCQYKQCYNKHLVSE